MKILLFGKNGQVGWELQRALSPGGKLIALDRQAADFEKLDGVIDTIKAVEPDVIINAAAYTAVDRAEDEAKRAYAINAKAVEVLAHEAARRGVWFIHYSTDYVFDGCKSGPYREDDLTNPLNVYGASKLEGEKALQSVGGDHLILRTSWVYGTHGQNFIKTVLGLASERSELKIVVDQIGTPTSAALIADATAIILHRLLRNSQAQKALSGVYHLTASGHTSWHGLAQYALREAASCGARSRVLPEQIAAIGSADYPTKARRPANSRLATEKVRNAFDIHLPDWREGVAHVVREIAVREHR